MPLWNEFRSVTFPSIFEESEGWYWFFFKFLVEFTNETIQSWTFGRFLIIDSILLTDYWSVQIFFLHDLVLVGYTFLWIYPFFSRSNLLSFNCSFMVLCVSVLSIIMFLFSFIIFSCWVLSFFLIILIKIGHFCLSSQRIKSNFSILILSIVFLSSILFISSLIFNPSSFELCACFVLFLVP